MILFSWLSDFIVGSAFWRVSSGHLSFLVNAGSAGSDLRAPEESGIVSSPTPPQRATSGLFEFAAL